MPDVVGKLGDEARDALDAAGYKVDFESDEGSVWVKSNWIVTSQDPAAGSSLSAGKRVILRVVRHSTTTPSPTPTPWAGLTDGTWNGGDVALGEPVRGRKRVVGDSLTSDYEITVTAPPTLTSIDGEIVTMTSPIHVSRVQDLGYGESFLESEFIAFGSDSPPKEEMYNETWGTRPTLICSSKTIAIGESMDCTVSFGTTPSALASSYWHINQRRAAAWPGQHP
ncbi:PASTA domain-containing protein [Microbacterium sp. CJ88]|uniref:PASTA domain-containing protein n=1 Tax=Microbacterium sp. CJ88 TaxID=3445672 RepID=UPI003F65778D